MRRPHVAIFTALANGHVNPVLGLCVELVRRGYFVTFATSPTYADRVRATGAHPVLFKPIAFEMADELERSFSLLPNGFWTICATLGYPALLTTAALTVLQLESFYTQNKPDVILYDRIAFAGRIFAKRFDVPSIQIFPHFAYFKKFSYRDNGVCVNPDPVLSFAKLLDTFLHAYGIEDDDNLWHIEALNIYFIPRIFQYHHESFDSRSCFVGPCLDRPYVPKWHRRGQSEPIILISDTSGSVDASYFNTFIAALGRSRFRVILSIDERLRKDALLPLAPNMEINERASHLEILPHVGLAICQAGMGSTLEALRFGVPIIGLPLTPYHEEIAYRIAELGLGLHVPRRTLTEKVIAAAIDDVLGNAGLLERVREMQQVLGASGGATEAADKIEAFLASYGTLRRSKTSDV